MKYICLFLFVFLVNLQLKAQEPVNTYAKLIEEKQLKKHVFSLASDSCNGRKPGTLGHYKAEAYIQTQFRKAHSLEDWTKNNFKQTFKIEKKSPAKVTLNTSKNKLKVFKDFVFIGFDSTHEQKNLPIIFGGFGKESDYQKLDVKDKAVLVLNTNLHSAMRPAQIAAKHGAKLCLVANYKKHKQFHSLASLLKPYLRKDQFKLTDYTNPEPYRSHFQSTPLITLSSSAVKKISGTSISRLVRKTKHQPLEEIKIKRNISFELTPGQLDTVSTNNLIAMIPGRNKKQYIVIGAHYDGLGCEGKDIFMGADDNATGTAAVIELAKAFSNAYQDGFQPETNLLFITFSAEESGIWGSQYFINEFDNPEQVKLMLNIDMIGRCDPKHQQECNYFYFIKNNLPDSLQHLNDRLCKKHYNLTPDYSSSINASDHRPFMKVGIPTIFYFDGKHKDLHRPTDTPEKIDYERMTRIVRLIFHTVWESSKVQPSSLLEITNSIDEGK